VRSGAAIHGFGRQDYELPDRSLRYLRFAPCGERACKAEAVQEAEAERGEPRPARRQRKRPAPRVHDFNGDQHDAKGNNRLDWRTGHADETKRSGCKRKAVCQGERGDRQRNAAPAANQDDQGQHKQQVIEPEQDVLDAQAQVACRDVAGAGYGPNDERCSGRRQPLGLHGTTKCLDARQHVS
jgi:hypothetical protein